MPTPCPPATFRCPQCGWHKTVIANSDVMLPGHTWFEACPECHHAPLTRVPATQVALAVAKLRALINH